MLDAFHVVKLGTQAVDEDRRRVQQEIHGHRGRKNDPLYGIRTILRCGQEKLTDRQRARLDRAIAADQRHDEILVAWLCAQKLRSAYRAKSPAEGRRIADDLIRSLPTFPIPESKRLGKTLKQWRDAFLAYFDTGRANNGPTETICESGFGWSGTGWSGWRRSCRPGCDSRSNWPACGVFPLNCPLGSARSAPFGPPR